MYKLLPYQKNFQISLFSSPLSSATCRDWGSSAEQWCTVHDLTYGVAFHTESGGSLSLMNIAAETLRTKSFVLSSVIIMFTALNPRSHSVVLHGNVFTLSCAAR
jgi:hypothetical protein